MTALFILAVLEALVATGAVIDWRTSRLPNWLTLGGLAAGIAASLLPGGVGLLHAFLGAGSALALLLPLWLLGITGAGDVKLLAMVGAFVGVPGIFFVLLATVVAGGAFALALGAVRGNAMQMVANAFGVVQRTAHAAVQGQRPDVRVSASVGKLPYGVCAFLGTSAWVAWTALQP